MAKTTTITLTNTFHNTSAHVRVTGQPDAWEYPLSDSQERRIRRTLCGVEGCTCGAVRDPEWRLGGHVGHMTLVRK